MRIPLGNNYVITVCKEGQRFVAIFAGVTLILFLIHPVLFTIGLFATSFCIAFFRDPEKIIPSQEGIIISAGDGKVTHVEIVDAPEEIKSLKGEEMLKISVFLSVFDIHVNRIPVGGKIKEVVYTPGKFFSAALEKSSTENERCAIVIENHEKDLIGCVQIAGLVAKRIVCEAKEGNEYKIGDRYGMIRFGSRMDIYLPKKYHAAVAVGQTAIGGETVLAKIK